MVAPRHAGGRALPSHSCFLCDHVAGRCHAPVAEREALPFGPGSNGVVERAGYLLGARHDLIELAVAIFAADHPIALSHLLLPHSAATNCAASVDSLSATVDVSPRETAVAIASK